MPDVYGFRLSVDSTRNLLHRFKGTFDEMKDELETYHGDSDTIDPWIAFAYSKKDIPEEERQEFLRAFYRRTPEDQERVIGPIFDDLVAYRQTFSMADTDQLDKDLGEVLVSSQQFMYLDSLIKNNQEYFDSHYSADQVRLLAVHQDLFTATFPMVNYMLSTHYTDYNLDYTLDVVPYPEATARLSAQSADFVYRQTMDSIEGKPLNNTLSLKIPEGVDKQIFFLDKDLAKGTLAPDSEACVSAQHVFDSMFAAIIDPESLQGKEQAKAGKNVFDMISIDGKPASEVFGKKYEDSPDREQLIKAEVINAITSGKNTIGLTTIQRDANNRPSFVVNNVLPDLTAAQPSIKEDYSAARRMFNWGPFRCRTRTDKQQALYTTGTAEQKLGDRVGTYVRGRIEQTKNRIEQSKNKASEKIKDAREKTRSTIHSLTKPIRNVKKYGLVRTLHNDKSRGRQRPPAASDVAYFSRAGIFVKSRSEQSTTAIFERNAERLGIRPLNTPEQRRSFADFVLVSQGYTPAQLLEDTSKMRKARKDAGKLVVKILKDPDKESAQSKLKSIMIEGTKKLIDVDVPLVDHSNPASVAENYKFAEQLELVVFGWHAASDMTGFCPKDQTKKDSSPENPFGIYPKDAVRPAMHSLMNYCEGVVKLGEFLNSPKAADPDLTLGIDEDDFDYSLVASNGLRGRYLVDTFTKMCPGETFRIHSVPPSEMAILGAAMKEAWTDTSKYDRKPEYRPLLIDYLKGHAPCPMPELQNRPTLSMNTRTAIQPGSLTAPSKERPGQRHQRERQAEAARREPKARESEDKGVSR